MTRGAPGILRLALSMLAVSGAVMIAATVGAGEASAESGATPVSLNSLDDGVACDAAEFPGTLTSEAILKVVKMKRRGIERCCRRFEAAPDATIWTRFLIDASGRVSSAVTSPGGDEQLGSCMTAEIKRWRFPKSKREMQVAFPFQCKAPAERKAVRNSGQ